MIDKKKSKLFIIFLAISFLIGGIFYKVVYSADAYTISGMGLEFYNGFVQGNMRPIQYILNNVFMNILGSGVKYEVIYIIYLTISLILLAISMYLVYTYIIKLINKNDKIEKLSKLKEILIFICVVIMFFNRYLSDNLLYLENFTMILALFLAVLASILYSKNIKFKNIVVLLLLIISEFSYQTMITAFVVLSLLFYTLKSNRKIDIKYLIKVTILFIIPLILMFTCSKLNINGVEVNDRFAKSDEYVSVFIGFLVQIFIYSTEYFLYCLLFSIIFNFIHLDNESNYITYNLFFIVFVSVVYSFSFALINSGTLSNRMAWCIGALAGIISLYIIVFRNDIETKKKRYIAGIIVLGIIELIIYFWIYGIYVRYNNTIKNNAEYVINYIEEYNKNHEEKIENIALYKDEKITEEKWYSVVVYLVPGIYNVEDNFYLHLKIHSNSNIGYMEADEKIYNEYFKGKDWDRFNLEQFVVKNNTLHFCKY